MKKTICICGGGSLGHVIAGWLSANGKAKVNILTNRPERWGQAITLATPEGKELKGELNIVSRNPAEVITTADVVLFCYPGFLIANELRRIKPYLIPNTYVGSVFSSTGFFFEALQILGETQPLWGFQRVPFIARVNEYGKSACLLGYKKALNIAVEHVSIDEKSAFCAMMENWFNCPVKLLNNYYEASLTNSNPLLHTSRLYTMFGGENEEKVFTRMIYFYEEWTVEAADMLIKMDEEFFTLLKQLPVAPDYLPRILDYYESKDAKSLAAKISSIQGFKGITSPMKKVDGCVEKDLKEGWMADYGSRYFTEDFPYGLKYIWNLCHEKGIDIPNIDKVYAWGMSKIQN